jgi:pimeloyl-ACP methyl ester carboxylesterase
MMECSGAGNPVTLLLGGRAAAWKPIQTEINRHARTCVFDHMGGRTTPLTAQEIARNVYILIKEAEINGPYVLVGSSVGGYITRLFASLYPEEVAGVVFLDSSHPDQNTRFLDALPPETPNDCQELKDYRSGLQGPHLIPIAPEIKLDFDGSAHEVRAIEQGLGKLPLVVLSAGRSDWPDCFPPQVTQELDQAWLNMQEDLKRLSSNSVQILATESGHAFDDPAGRQAVIESIRRVIEAVQNGVPIQ